MTDRRVHASYPGMEIVRYERAGKWYLESSDGSRRARFMQVADAVDSAIWGLDHGGEVFYNLPGGLRFDELVRRARVRR